MVAREAVGVPLTACHQIPFPQEDSLSPWWEEIGRPAWILVCFGRHYSAVGTLLLCAPGCVWVCACVSACARGGMPFREGTAGGTVGVPGVWFSVCAVGSGVIFILGHRTPLAQGCSWEVGDVWRSVVGPFLHRDNLCAPRTRRAWRGKSHNLSESRGCRACLSPTQPVALPSPSWEVAFASASSPSH